MADFGNYLSILSHVKLSYRVTTCQTLQLNGHVHCIDVCFVAMNAAKKETVDEDAAVSHAVSATSSTLCYRTTSSFRSQLKTY